MRDIVEDYWESLSDEEKSKWTIPDEEIAKQAAEAKAKLDAMHVRLFGSEPPALPGIASAIAQPQSLVQQLIGPSTPVASNDMATIFLDGVIKRPATGTLSIRCFWCEQNKHLLNEDLQDGWHLIEDAAKPDRPAHYMCPDCAKTEIPE